MLLMDGQLDVPFINMLEQKLEKSRFTRVDSDVVDHLIAKDDASKSELEGSKKSVLSSVFRSQLPKLEQVEFNVEAQAMGETVSPIIITQAEYMRRMKEMASIQPGMSFMAKCRPCTTWY